MPPFPDPEQRLVAIATALLTNARRLHEEEADNLADSDQRENELVLHALTAALDATGSTIVQREDSRYYSSFDRTREDFMTGDKREADPIEPDSDDLATVFNSLKGVKLTSGDFEEANQSIQEQLQETKKRIRILKQNALG